MNIERVLNGLDQLFSQHRIGDVEQYLINNMDIAKEEPDMYSYITLLNEMIGFCRDTSQYEKAVSYCKLVEQEIENQNLEGSVAHATTLLNIANAYRAASLLEESMENYKKVYPIYDAVLDKTDFRYASLNNNLSLLYQEMGDYERACECLNRALEIVALYPEARIELAVTHTNLAMSLLKLKREQEAESHLNDAFIIFEKDEDKDYHYSAALSAMSELQYKKGNIDKAIEYGEHALVEIEKNVGRTKAYEVVQQNLAKMKTEMANQTEQKPGDNAGNKSAEPIERQKGIELCRAYYNTYKSDFLQGFEEYKAYMAFGLVGDGSDCLGFDDKFSRDHDFGPGFCVFIPEELYGIIGDRLEIAYEELPKEFMGYTRKPTKQGENRIGVRTIEGFYQEYIGVAGVPQTDEQWLTFPPERFRAAISGEIFDDYNGEFTRIRKELKQYYPESIRIRMLANELSMMAQTGQYNYERMLKRGQKVTAQIILGKYMEHTMNVVYLLNKEFAPFYKWKHAAMTNLLILPEVMDILNAISDMEYGDERIPLVIEMIAKLVVNELLNQKLTDTQELYLDHQAHRVLELGNVTKDVKFNGQKRDNSCGAENMQIDRKGTGSDMEKIRLIEKLITLEWEAFDKVDNEGGRADCQDDYKTFSIMRKSQYLAWTEEMIKSFIMDFETANEKGINLIAQKYGYMMESTAPQRFQVIKKQLMPVSEEKRAIIEQIVAIQVGFMEEFASAYPLSAGNARSIHTSEDHLYNTSYETYLRGELMTYSDETLMLYGRFVVEKAQNNENLAKQIMNETAILYGYDSVDDLEMKLKKALE